MKGTEGTHDRGATLVVVVAQGPVELRARWSSGHGSSGARALDGLRAQVQDHGGGGSGGNVNGNEVGAPFYKTVEQLKGPLEVQGPLDV